MLVSLAVNGTNRFHHCKQFTKLSTDAVFVEARANSELFLLLGNRGANPLPITFHPNNLRLFGCSNVTLPFDSKAHFRVCLIDSERLGYLRVIGIDGEERKLVLGSKQQLLHDGVNITTAAWTYPNPFPADGPRSDMLIVGSEEFLDKQFQELVDVSSFDVSGDYNFVAGVNSGIKTRNRDGYVYVMTHPNYYGWVKIGSTTNLKDRLCTYQTSDPLRRFEYERFYAVDDRNAVERWVLLHLGKQHAVQGEWVNCVVADALRLTEEALDLINAGA